MLLLLCARLIANRRRRRNPTGDAVPKVGDSVTWERFPTVADYNQPSRDSFNFGLKHALVELSMGACAIANLPAQLLDDLPLLERLHLWGNLLEFELGVLRPTRREMYVIAGRVVLAIRDAILTCARKLTRVGLIYRTVILGRCRGVVLDSLRTKIARRLAPNIRVVGLNPGVEGVVRGGTCSRRYRVICSATRPA